jgi:hypothetical protein
MVRDGRLTDTPQSDLAGLLRDVLQQQTAMLQVQAESLRVQRMLVERLLGASSLQSQTDGSASGVAGPASDDASVCADRETAATPAEAPSDPPPRPAPGPPPGPAPGAAAADQSAARGARYYQPRPSPAADGIAPEQLELLRRLREMRDAGDLILQFGPYKGTTLANVAISNPEYIRQLMTRALRPEVRAAAGRLVQAIDAADEHKRRPMRGPTRRGQPVSR